MHADVLYMCVLSVTAKVTLHADVLYARECTPVPDAKCMQVWMSQTGGK
jgi:hypothetical protein